MAPDTLDDLTTAAADCLATLGTVEAGDLAELYGFDPQAVEAFGAEAIAQAYKVRAEAAAAAARP